MIRINLSRAGCALAFSVASFAFAAPPDDVAPPTGPVEVIRTDAATQLAMPGRLPFHETTAQVSEARAIAIGQTPAVVYTWNETDEAGGVRPFYAISLDGQQIATVREADYTLKLRHGDFVPQQAQRAPADSNLYVVQFVTQALSLYREQIEATGAKIHRYQPHNAYVVAMNPEQKAQVEGLPYVRFVGQYHAAYRLEESLQNLLNAPIAAGPAKRYRIEVFEKGAAQKNALAEYIVSLGGTIDVLDDGGHLFEATLTPQQLRAVALRDETAFIDPWTPPRTMMNNVRIVGGANNLETLAGYTGAGVRGEVMDDGCQAGQSGAMHPDFVGRLAIRGGTNFPNQSHGTATYGIVFGSGAGNSTARGMLPSAFGYFNDWNHPGSRYSDIGQLVNATYQCVFQSNSWGFSPQLVYTSTSHEMDDAVFDFDIVILHSQGNEGSQWSVEHAWGKNVVGVGGIVHQNDSNLNNDFWGGTGSIGPASDGRIKPDLSYYYDSIRTTAPGSSYTNNMGGTSAACPETAGHFGLFFQMWKDGIFGNPVSGGTVFAERPHSSTARAVMFNTARSYPFSGLAHDLTRTHQGWGLPNVQKIYELRNNMFIVDEDDVLTEFGVARYTVKIVSGQPFHNELRVTLVWTDPPGTTSASQHRINNLDLKVISPSGTIYWGNNGLLIGNWSTAGGSPNTIDTTENVFLQNPMAGEWTVEVIAADINQDGRPETPLTMDVDFALVISGGDAGNDCNDNGILDECDFDCGLPGCNVPGCGQGQDCNDNDYLDDCELVNNDCNNDGIPDECQLAGNDCNQNGQPDDCDVEALDCNGNDVPDACDEAELLALAGTPQDVAVCPGGDAAFSVNPVPGAAYAWFKGATPLQDNTRIQGSQSVNLSIDDVEAADSGPYSVEITMGCITASSPAGQLHVLPTSLSVTQEPVAEMTVCATSGQSAVFEFHISNEIGVDFQWYKDGVPLANGGRISGAQSAKLQITPALAEDSGHYSVEAINLCGATASSAPNRGFLNVTGGFLQNPQNTCTAVGGTARFHAGAAEVSGLQHFWYRNGEWLLDGVDPAGMVISGASTDTLTISNVPATYNGHDFMAVTLLPATGCVGQSSPADLVVGACGNCPFYGDVDGDLDVDLQDMAAFMACFGATVNAGHPCECANVNTSDNVVDLADWEALVGTAAGPW